MFVTSDSFRDSLLSQSVNPPKFEPPLHGGCALRVVPTAKSASRFTSAVFDSDYLARLDGLEVSEANGHERNEVFQEDGFTTENNDRNFPMSEVLLVFKSAIHSQENVELRGLGCGQELTVLKSREASIPGGLTFVPGEVVAQSFAHTLVEEDAHSCLGRQQLLSFFQCGDGHLA